MTDQELIYTMALTRLLPFSAAQQQTLLREVGSATAIYENRRDLGRMMEHFSPRAAETVAYMEAELPRCEQELRYARDHQIKVLALHDEKTYPTRLLQCEDAPLILFLLGGADLNARHIISVVGTRRCTERGRDLCTQLAKDLRRLLPGTLIVSGLAYGIDIAAHRSALASGLPTVGVLAHGLDEIYPRLHRQTAIEMLPQGGLLTEYMSHTQIEKMNFVQRNRIVAGLADATIVVESAERGGSLITAEMAGGYHREVFAFPGRVSDPQSAGCNALICSNAARLITNARDLLEGLNWEAEEEPDGQKALNFGAAETAPSGPPPPEQAIVLALQQAGSDLDMSALMEATSLSVAQLMPLLLTLELQGRVKRLAGNRFHLIGG